MLCYLYSAAVKELIGQRVHMQKNKGYDANESTDARELHVKINANDKLSVNKRNSDRGNRW